jgi:hypothetical protein
MKAKYNKVIDDTRFVSNQSFESNISKNSILDVVDTKIKDFNLSIDEKVDDANSNDPERLKKEIEFLKTEIERLKSLLSKNNIKVGGAKRSLDKMSKHELISMLKKLRSYIII